MLESDFRLLQCFWSWRLQQVVQYVSLSSIYKMGNRLLWWCGTLYSMMKWVLYISDNLCFASTAGLAFILTVELLVQRHEVLWAQHIQPTSTHSTNQFRVSNQDRVDVHANEGIRRGARELSKPLPRPNWPLELLPTAQTSPDSTRKSVCLLPAATSVTASGKSISIGSCRTR